MNMRKDQTLKMKTEISMEIGELQIIKLTLDKMF